MFGIRSLAAQFIQRQQFIIRRRDLYIARGTTYTRRVCPVDWSTGGRVGGRDWLMGVAVSRCLPCDVGMTSDGLLQRLAATFSVLRRLIYYCSSDVHTVVPSTAFCADSL